MRERTAQVSSVSQVNQYIKNMFVREYALRDFYMKGEVSNCKYHSSGHIYFTLKDASSQMACVMFAGQRSGLAFRMEEGQSVIALGSVSVYERDGKYQFYAREILLDGAGALYEQYERLKKHLFAEGLFDETHKKPIPQFATRIGVVTASTGAALQDVCNIASRRNPYVQLVLYPARVQGDGAKESVVAGIQYLDTQGLDIILVVRGGGSIEDLWAFNEEMVARAIYACKTPVISGVGHETDTTIADYVADMRAPTPSAAAELSVFSYIAFREAMEDMQWQLEQGLKQRIARERDRVKRCELSLKNVSPENILLQKRQYGAELALRLEQAMQRILEDRKHRLAVYAGQLEGLSPLARLQTGYAYVSGDGGHIASVDGLRQGDALRIDFADGYADATVERTERLRKLHVTV